MRSILVVSHDAGGAEVISHWIKNNNKYNFIYVLDGPAKNIFKRVLGVEYFSNLKDGFSYCDSLICGTSWQSDLEINAIIEAKKRGFFSIAVLDHWVNYEERFKYNKKSIFPDELWVFDSYARAIAKKTFKDKKISIKTQKNFYIEESIKKIKKNKEVNEVCKILFLSENISDHALKKFGNENFWGYDEFKALNFLLRNLHIFGHPKYQIKIRPHPSDKANKYQAYISKIKNIEVFVSNEKNLFEDISESNVITGCETMAMVIALFSGRKVYSCIPPGGRNCSLPFKEIVHLKKLIKK